MKANCENDTLRAITTDYDSIRFQPGYYWTRGVIPYRGDEDWFMVRVEKPHWTKESGNDHCRWYYMDGSGGKEIESGEWVFIPKPSP